MRSKLPGLPVFAGNIRQVSSSPNPWAASPQGKPFSLPINRGDIFGGRKRDYYESWGSAKRHRCRGSKAPTQAARKLPRPEPRDKDAEESSRRSMRPTMFFPTRTSASAMTSSDSLGSIPTSGPTSPAALRCAALTASSAAGGVDPGRHLWRFSAAALAASAARPAPNPNAPRKGPCHYPGQCDPDL